VNKTGKKELIVICVEVMVENIDRRQVGACPSMIPQKYHFPWGILASVKYMVLSAPQIHTPNGTLIGPAVSAQLTDRQRGRQTDKQITLTTGCIL